MNARMALDEVNDLLRAQLPEGDWDTIGGLLLAKLGHVPVEGESVEVDGWQLTAQRVVGRRIGRVRVHRAPRLRPAPRPRDRGADALRLRHLRRAAPTWGSPPW